MDGSNRARVGLLPYVRNDRSSPILLLKDIIDRTISSFRFVPCNYHLSALCGELFPFFLAFHNAELFPSNLIE
jgi:hypothetical protein